jgi:hypothetical protein
MTKLSPAAALLQYIAAKRREDAEARFERSVAIAAENERLRRRKHELALALALKLPPGWRVDAGRWVS